MRKILCLAKCEPFTEDHKEFNKADRKSFAHPSSFFKAPSISDSKVNEDLGTDLNMRPIPIFC